jgi:hypothetical protein
MLFRLTFLLASLLMPLLLAGQSLLPKNQHVSLSTAESSVLASGKWFKMKMSCVRLADLSHPLDWSGWSKVWSRCSNLRIQQKPATFPSG